MYLAEGLKEIDGVNGFERDPRVTRWSIYFWNFKYDQDGFAGIPRDKFLEAVNAEGVPFGVRAHGAPIYQERLFKSMTGSSTGPRMCPGYDQDID